MAAATFNDGYCCDYDAKTTLKDIHAAIKADPANASGRHCACIERSFRDGSVERRDRLGARLQFGAQRLR